MPTLNILINYLAWLYGELFIENSDIDASRNGFLDLFEVAALDAIPRKTRRFKQSCPWIDNSIKRLSTNNAVLSILPKVQNLLIIGS